jgi:CheY-like chemotaxis protein
MATVLIAEDNDDLCTIFAKVFRKTAFQIDTVQDGKQAIEYLNAKLPDIMILDINMPKISGLDVLAHARNIQGSKHIHIIVVTGNYLVGNMPQVDLADLFLVKPVSPRELVRLAERLTGSVTAVD